MHLLRHLPIHRKMMVVTLVTVAAVMLAAAMALFTFEVYRTRRLFVRDVESLGLMFADNCATPLGFRDADVTRQVLGALRANPRIHAAAVLSIDGSVFASYGEIAGMTELAWATAPASSAEYDRGLLVTRPIELDGKAIGTLVLSADLQSIFREALLVYSGVFGLVLVGAGALGYGIASRLQGVVTEPLLRLASTAQTIARSKDYSIRAEHTSSDEMGTVAAAFNEMLDQIQSRDAALRDSRQRYEIAVRGSTDGLWDWDLRTGEMYFSPRWKEMLGYREAELLNTHETFERLVHPADLAKVRTGLEACRTGSRSEFIAEFRMQHRDGREVWILSRGAALHDSDGVPIRMAGSHTDVTARRQADAEREDLNQKLRDASRRAGMAEIATGVLHNVGNVLNSINVSASTVEERMRHSKVRNLERVAHMLAEHAADLPRFLTSDPKGRQLNTYLIALAEHLTTERTQLVDELLLLRRNVDHVKNIVARQQSYASAAAVHEAVSLFVVLDEAAAMHEETMRRNDIHVVRDYRELPVLSLDKHKTLQIFVNLIRNAIPALLQSPSDTRTLRLAVEPINDQLVRASVSDSGIGISAENLTRIFQHGFTTKADGHGFGLHSGALAAKEMGGRLYAESDGPGQGATFILELPLPQAGEPNSDAAPA